jgi:hypothetical protein
MVSQAKASWCLVAPVGISVDKLLILCCSNIPEMHALTEKYREYPWTRDYLRTCLDPYILIFLDLPLVCHVSD